MNKIICYCSGGLGNRLKPIASSWALSLQTNRELVLVWEPTLRCMAPFESLFSNTNIKFMKSIELPSLTNVKVYCPDGAADYEYNLNGFTGLRDLVRKAGSTVLDTKTIIKDTTENIVVFANTFFPDISLSAHKSIFRYMLTINKEILDKVDEFWKNSGLTTDFIGVHARATDFEDSGVNVNTYLNSMSYLSNPCFFVCSDSAEYEQHIKKEKEKNGCIVVIRSDKKYVSKQKDGKWSNNVFTPTDSVQDSMVDMLLLARTNFCIFHPNSSFAHLVEYYKGYYIEPFKD